MGLLLDFSIQNKILFIVVLSFSQGCFSFRMSPERYDHYFTSKNIDYTLNYYYPEDRKIFTVATGNSDHPHIYFFHGAPGSSSAFKSYLSNSDLLSQYHLISVDRPGYGYSDFGHSTTDLDYQATLLGQVLKNNPNDKPVILVGHSLGGAVVAKLAMKYPEKIDGLIIVAGSVDPKLEPQEWFRKPLHSNYLRWLLPRSLRVTNDEIYFLKGQLEKMIPDWKKIKAKVSVIHGGKDDLVHPDNVSFIEKMLNDNKPNIILEPEANHFIPWKNEGLLIDAINNMMNEIQLSQSK